MSPEIVVDKPDALARRLVERLERAFGSALANRNRFALALPGGSVATSFFPALSAADVDWTQADFFWGDERAVVPEDPESNFGLARSLWLEPRNVPDRRIHRMHAEEADLERAAADYAREMVRRLGEPPRLDLALLGMGPDGHVCSLFPGHPLLHEEKRWVAPVLDSPKPPPRRLTLTMPVLATADLVVVAALGEAKAEALRRALGEPDSSLPVAIATRRAKEVVFFVDEAAARLRPGG
jgi:6-phosphogluconolactonase